MNGSRTDPVALPYTPAVPGLTFDDVGLVYRGGELLQIPPRERAVLSMLVRNYPATVSKDDFARTVWRDAEMSDASLARCISMLRPVLAPAGRQVEAVYGIGYRLTTRPVASAPATVEAPPEPRWAEQFSPQAVETFAFCRNLLQQRTPAALGIAIEKLRQLVREVPYFWAAKVALAESLAVAIGWGHHPTTSGVEEGLSALNDVPLTVQVQGAAAARAALLDMAWQFEDAGASFEIALRSEGRRPDTLLAFSRHLLYVDQPEQAVEVLTRARGLAPHQMMLRMTLSRALAQAGRGEAALAESKAALAAHPGELVLTAFSLAMNALVAPNEGIAACARRLAQGLETPPFVWTVLSFVLARCGHRDEALAVIDSALDSPSATVGDGLLYAASLAGIQEYDRAAALLAVGARERSGMLAMVLRDPSHSGWLRQHPVGAAVLRQVFGRLEEAVRGD